MRRYVVFGFASLAAMLVSSELTLSLPLFGMGPDLLVLVVVAFAMGERPRVAATAAFCAGLFKDLLLTTPSGLFGLAYALTAYIVAQIGVPRGVGPVVGTFAGATFFSHLIHGLGVAFLSTQADASPLPRILIATTAYNALVSPLLMPLLARIVRVDSAAQAGSAAD